METFISDDVFVYIFVCLANDDFRQASVVGRRFFNNTIFAYLSAVVGTWKILLQEILCSLTVRYAQRLMLHHLHVCHK